MSAVRHGLGLRTGQGEYRSGITRVTVQTNSEDFQVDQDLSGRCNDAASFCGVRDRLYPDKRAMGFPFDRSARVGADNLQAFVTPNMVVQDCVIVHKDEIINERKQ
jgi:tyrosinase